MTAAEIAEQISLTALPTCTILASVQAPRGVTMKTNVHPIAHRADAARILRAAAAIREADLLDADSLAENLAALLSAVAQGVQSTADPGRKFTEDEQWRWSATVGVARRISRAWAP